MMLRATVPIAIIHAQHAEGERSWLLQAPAPRRPGLERKTSAPARIQGHRVPAHHYFSFPSFEPAPRSASQRVGDEARQLETEAEAGCFRACLRIGMWWAWRRWRR